jgi:hypothetical protein
MRNILCSVLMLMTFHSIIAQEAYIGFGPNQTTYDYTNSDGENNSNIYSDSGNHFEGGYVFFTPNRKLSFPTAITFDGFNATGGNALNDYSWRTSFVGVQGGVRYGLIDQGRGADIAFLINAGVTVKKMISGNQKINGQVFDLMNESEFNGIFKGVYFGPDLRYFVTQEIAIGIGYTYSLNFGSTQEEQTLNINSGAFTFKLFSSFDY